LFLMFYSIKVLKALLLEFYGIAKRSYRDENPPSAVQ